MIRSGNSHEEQPGAVRYIAFQTPGDACTKSLQNVVGLSDHRALLEDNHERIVGRQMVG